MYQLHIAIILCSKQSSNLSETEQCIIGQCFCNWDKISSTHNIRMNSSFGWSFQRFQSMVRNNMAEGHGSAQLLTSWPLGSGTQREMPARVIALPKACGSDLSSKGLLQRITIQMPASGTHLINTSTFDPIISQESLNPQIVLSLTDAPWNFFTGS